MCTTVTTVFKAEGKGNKWDGCEATRRTEWDGVVVGVAAEPPQDSHEPMREIQKDDELRADAKKTLVTSHMV